MEFQKVPPFSNEAEQSVLGIMLINRNSIEAIISMLSKDDFYRESHREIFEVLVDIYKSGSPIDLITVTEKLKQRKSLEQVGGVSEITHLMGTAHAYDNAIEHCRIISDKALARGIIRTSYEASQKAFEGKEDTKVIAEVLNAEINELASKHSLEYGNGILDLSDINYISALDYKHSGIETGFRDYDYHVEDWKEQEITIVFGRNGEGKTTFISQVIAHAMEKRVKTFLKSKEMSDNKIQMWLYRQVIGNKSRYLRTIETKYAPKVEATPEAIKAIKKWHKGILFLDDRNNEAAQKDIEAFFNTLRLSVIKHKIKLVIIDNLMAVLEENADSLYSDQANFVQMCKDFAVKYKCHVVLLAHPRKEKGECNGYANLEKNDISGSGNIPNKADNIIAIERDWREEREYDAFISSLKDRESGQRKVMKYNFSKDTLRFYNDYTPENQNYSWEKYLDKAGFNQIEHEEPLPFD